MDNYNCNFKTYRKRKVNKVFSLSLWKNNIGYIFNLSNSLLWWARHFPELFPDWNIRIYCDRNIYSSLQGKDLTEWEYLIERLKKYDYIELWFYDCLWGKEAFYKPHIGTFGSLVRFHAFDDPDLEVVVCHNLEMLTSPKDRERIMDWLRSGKTYNWYVYWDAVYQYQFVLPYKIPGKYSLNASGFGIQKIRGKTENIFFDSIQLIKKLNLKKFPYGVDEVILTKILKPKMTWENTFITDGTSIKSFYEIFPDIMGEFESEFLTLTPEAEEQYKKYYMKDEDDILFSDLFGFFQYYPDIMAKFIIFIKQKLVSKNYKNNPEIKNSFYRFLFDNLYSDTERKLSIIFNNLKKRYNNNDILLSIISNTIFLDIDFPGLIIKNKNFGEKYQIFTPLSKNIKKLYGLE